MYKSRRHVEDTLISVVALLIFGAVGFVGLGALMLTLALGF